MGYDRGRFDKVHPNSRVVAAFRILLLMLAMLFACRTGAAADQYLESGQLPEFVASEARFGSYLGTTGGVLVHAGGVVHSKHSIAASRGISRPEILILETPESAWRPARKSLPQAMAYGASVSTKPKSATEEGIVLLLGGIIDGKPTDRVVQLRWNGTELEVDELPPLPQPVGYASAAVLQSSGKKETVFVAGGLFDLENSAPEKNFWALDLSVSADQRKWRILPTWPGPARFAAVAAARDGSFYLFSGARPLTKNGNTGLQLLRDAYRFTPDDVASGSWQEITSPPTACAAAPSPAMNNGAFHIVICGGLSNGEEAISRSPTLSYNVVTDRWAELLDGESAPLNGLVVEKTLPTSAATGWQDRYVFTPTLATSVGTISRESETAIQFVKPTLGEVSFGLANWVILIVYMAILVGAGFYFAGREQSVDDFFLAGGRVPWWAAGLSIFGTMLSAITYLSIPAKAFAEDWVRFVFNMGIVVISPIVVFIYLPFFRRLRITTAYEYLEKRFSLGIRLLGSATFVAFQLGRMGIVVLLPALALSAVTGLDQRFCILAMGLLSTIYTVLGGIEAVIWTDVLQVFVLLGGAIAALFIIGGNLDGGLSQVVTDGAALGKFNLVNSNWDWTGDALIVIVLSAVFTNLVPYTTDQAVIQRYLTTKNERQAAAAIWTNALLTIPASLLFFFVGTALFVFFAQQPGSLPPLEKPDQIFPWFIARQMPPGLAGLVIAGVFAASMSSLDSSMHSIATAISTDFLRRLGPHLDDHKLLKQARWLIVLLGILATVTAVLMTQFEIKYLFDYFLQLMGLIGGTLVGIFALGIFFRRPGARSAWLAALASFATLAVVKWATPLSDLLYAPIALAVCLSVGLMASRLLPDPPRDLTGLTIYNRPARGAL